MDLDHQTAHHAEMETKEEDEEEEEEEGVSEILLMFSGVFSQFFI